MKTFYIIITLLAISLISISPDAASAGDCQQAVGLSREASVLLNTNPQEAEGKFSRAVKMCPDSASLAYNLAISYYMQNRAEEAIRGLEKALKLNPDFAKAINDLAFLLQSEDRGRAVRLARRAVRLEPENSNFRDTLDMLTENIDDNPPDSHARNDDAIAVIIGNMDYKNAKKVEFAINDAATIKKYVKAVLGYREGNIFFLANATKGDFELYFGNKGNHEGKLFNAVKQGKSDVFIYYSGHGAPGLKDRKGYFVPVEADPNYIELGGYSAEVFYENISMLPARSLTVVLDACFSGATIFDNISPMVLEINNPVVKMKKGVVISSSRGNQVSSWYNEKKHGMFTYFFLKGIYNRNADIDKDGAITFEELYNYISDKTEGVPYYARRVHGVEQTPTIEGDYKGKVLARFE